MALTSARRPKHAAACLALALGLLVPGPGFAAGGDSATAEVLFREGRKLSEAGDIEGACAKFRESKRLDPAVGTTFNIADCEERLGHLAEAWSSFQEVVQLLPATDRRRTMAADRAAALDKRLPRLRIVLGPGAPPETRVTRDGVELGAASLGVELPVNPGPHVVVARADGRAERRHEVALAEAQRLSLTVAPGERGASSAAPGARRSPSSPATIDTGEGSGRRTLGYVLGGVGVAGILTGAVAGILVLQKKGAVDDNCNADKRCNDDGLAAVDSGKTLSVVSTVGFVAGAVGLGAGAYLLLTAAPSSDGVTAASATFTGAF